MWIERIEKKQALLKILNELKNQVIVVRGARQVGKTAFVNNILKDWPASRQVKINLRYPSKRIIDNTQYFGRDFFGNDPSGGEFLTNLKKLYHVRNEKDFVVVFIDEADQYPISLEAIQDLAEYSSTFKFIFTGSNLENIKLSNTSTGRKVYFDIYPISFFQFLKAANKTSELEYIDSLIHNEQNQTDFFHNELNSLLNIFIRLGGMPKIVGQFLDHNFSEIPSTAADLVTTIEENVKAILDEKAKLYEYEDILRTIGRASLDTLKISKLQANHVSRNEAKRLLNKTVGARVAHKIRLFSEGTDLSKYIIFDTGVLNYLLNGSDLLEQKIDIKNMAILYESFIGIELISGLPSRDDLLYWKSSRGAQIEYLLKSPQYAAIDVKTTRGDVKSLESCAIFEEELDVIIKISKEKFKTIANFKAKIFTLKKERSIPLIIMPHYLIGHYHKLLKNF